MIRHLLIDIGSTAVIAWCAYRIGHIRGDRAGWERRQAEVRATIAHGEGVAAARRFLEEFRKTRGDEERPS